MLTIAKKLIRSLSNKFGYDFIPTQSATGFPADFDEDTVDICRYVKPFTMTSNERIFALCRSIEYIARHNIAGDIVECGVWKGGSMMAIARTLTKIGGARKLHLFDTFEGM